MSERKYFDLVCKRAIPESEVKSRYGCGVVTGNIDPAACSYREFLASCLEDNGGSLRELQSNQSNSTYRLFIRETLVREVSIEADSMSKALDTLRDEYYYSNIVLNADDFEQVEFGTVCDECGEQVNELIGCFEVDPGKPQSRILCRYCMRDLLDKGDIIRCPDCGTVFSRETSADDPGSHQTTCPYCGKEFH